MSTRTVRFGVVGCGLMGREFASAAARWCHLTDLDARPEIVAVCSRRESSMEWFRRHVPSVRQAVTDYRRLLENPEIEAVYCAVPHNLHELIYRDTLDAGKHLFGEKPFGMDLAANRAIAECARRHPDLFVRCCSQFIFYPAVQRIGRMIESGAFGRIHGVRASFLHCSDMDPAKPINWKRRVETNGEYGVMGDLGMHICLLPFRAGWVPGNVRAILSNIVRERPDGQGGMASCDTWDNATLLCEARDGDGEPFPLTIRTERISPGEKNTWAIEIQGDRGAARFSTRNPGLLETLEFRDGRQDWRQEFVGYTPTYPTISGAIFEFGFGDALLQMWAAYLDELVNKRPRSRFAAVATIEETTWSHRLFTAALESQRTGQVTPV